MRGAKSLLALPVGVLVAVGAGLLPLGLGLVDAHDIEVRTVPWRTQGGRISDANRPGQGFRCQWDGLERVDVAVVALGPTRDAQLELLLRADSPDGAVLRRARVVPAELTEGRGFVAFEFQPIEDSAGRAFWFELGPGDGTRHGPYCAWIRYHGQPGVDTPWGDRVVPGAVFEGPIVDNARSAAQRATWGMVPHPNLAAMAFAVEDLPVADGEVRLELWGEGSDPRTDPALRSVTLEGQGDVRGGYAYFDFEPIAESRWKEMHYRLTVPEGARVVGFESGLSFKTFHGGTAGPPALLGMSSGTQVHTGRSLIFRADSSPTRREVVARIIDRAGWRLWAGALCWFLGTVLALRLTFPNRP